MTSPPVLDLRSARLIHGVLAAGIAVLFLVFAAVILPLKGPLLRGNPALPIASSALALASAASSACAIFFRRRLPGRGAEVPPESYWTPEIAGQAMMVWVLCEGAGVMAAVGFLLTGRWPPVAAAVFAWCLLMVFAPGRLAAG
jgi:drug/metabolite transporter (DMT)-like permease